MLTLHRNGWQWIDMKWVKPVIHVLYYQVPVPDTTCVESTKIYLDGCCIHHNEMESTKYSIVKSPYHTCF